MTSATGPEGDTSGLSHTLQGHVDDIRSHIQCGICIRPLYEPFTLACGHTFCYSCLTSWFGGGKRNKTCPDCRAPVKTQPTPAYLVRTLVQLFTSRAELLEKGETTAEHEKNQREEAEKLENDKKNHDPKTGGLFRGTFNKKHPIAQPVVDLEDNVVRCPHCSWELEGGTSCEQCGYRQPPASVTDSTESSDFSDSELNSEMTDYMDDEIEDGFAEVDDFGLAGVYGAAFDIQRQLYDLHRRPYPLPHNIPGDPYEYQFGGSSDIGYPDTGYGRSDDEEEDGSEDTDMDSFIDDEDPHEDGENYYSESDDRSTLVGGHGGHGYRRGRNWDEDARQGSENGERRGYRLDSERLSIGSSSILLHESQNGENGLPHDVPMSHGEDEDTTSSEEEDEDDSEDDDSDDDDDEEDDEDDEEPIRPAVNGGRRLGTNSSRPMGRRGGLSSLQSRRNLRRGTPRQDNQTAGTSAVNAINVDDDSDEGPVGPSRRARGRRN